MTDVKARAERWARIAAAAKDCADAARAVAEGGPFPNDPARNAPKLAEYEAKLTAARQAFRVATWDQPGQVAPGV